MKLLLDYLNGLPKADRQTFVARCGTSEGYLRKAISKGQRLGEGLCISLDRESGGAVRCEDMRPDVDWGYLRSRPVETAPEDLPVALGSAQLLPSLHPNFLPREQGGREHG